jgi:hypothetical protein
MIRTLHAGRPRTKRKHSRVPEEIRKVVGVDYLAGRTMRLGISQLTLRFRIFQRPLIFTRASS